VLRARREARGSDHQLGDPNLKRSRSERNVSWRWNFHVVPGDREGRYVYTNYVKEMLDQRVDMGAGAATSG